MPFAREVQHIAVLAYRGNEPMIALAETKDCRLADGRNLAGDAANVVIFDGVKPLRSAPAPAHFEQKSTLLMGAAIRSVETAGALETVLSLSVAYANERVAFERPIGKFQAVQQNLARLAGEVAAALAVSGSAADTLAQAGTDDEAVFLEAASAKIRTAEAAAEGSAIAHQVFGAIGFTKEQCCTASRCACCPGVTTSATKAIGQLNSAAMSPAAVPTIFGRWWRRDDGTSAIRSDPPAARMRRAPRGGARVPRGGDRGRHVRSASAADGDAHSRAFSRASAPRAGSA